MSYYIATFPNEVKTHNTKYDPEQRLISDVSEDTLDLEEL